MDERSIKEEVRENYAREALQVRESKDSPCCGSATRSYEAITSNLYTKAIRGYGHGRFSAT
jgi:hypothetical protein